MKKLLFLFALIMSAVACKAQLNPVRVSSPYIFQQYVHVKGGLYADSVLAASDNSNKVATTAWIKAGGYTITGDLTLNSPINGLMVTTNNGGTHTLDITGTSITNTTNSNNIFFASGNNNYGANQHIFTDLSSNVYLSLGNGSNGPLSYAPHLQVTGAPSLANDVVRLTDLSTYIKLSSLSATAPITYNNTTGVIGANATSLPTANFLSLFDGSNNLSGNNFLSGFQSVTTAAGTTTLTVASPYKSLFTGTTTQTVVLPVATTLVNGTSFQFDNISTGVVTVQTSGAVVLQAMAQNTRVIATMISSTGGTGAGAWSYTYSPLSIGSIYAPINSPTFTGTVTIPIASNAFKLSTTATGSLITQDGAGTVIVNANTGSGNSVLSSSPSLSNPYVVIPTIAGGYFYVNGATSGVVTVNAQAATGSYNFNLPTSLGASGTLLTAGGAGVTNPMTWTDIHAYAFTTPTATTPSTADNSTLIATTAYVQANLNATAIYFAAGLFSGSGTSGSPYDIANGHITSAMLASGVFANPTASVGLTAINGAATTVMRSDAAPALNQAIAPTWTGSHIFQNSSITTTITPWVFLNNGTVAVSGTTQLLSPALSLRAHYWTGSADAYSDMMFWNEADSYGTYLNAGYASNGGSVTKTFSVSQFGDLQAFGTSSSGSIQISKTTMATTSSDGVILTSAANTASSGTPVRYSPDERYTSMVWNTSGTPASNQLDFKIENRPVSGAAPTGALYWSSRLSTSGSGAYTDLLSLSNSGNLTLNGSSTFNGQLTIGATATTNLLVLNGNAAGTTTSQVFQNAGTNIGFLGSEVNAAGGVAANFMAYTYGNNAYSIWTNGSKRLAIDGSGNALFGNTTGTLTATPLSVSLGGTYGNNTPGSPANIKLRIYDGGTPTAYYGIGASAGIMEFQATGMSFFTNGSTTASLNLDASGNTNVTGNIAIGSGAANVTVISNGLNSGTSGGSSMVVKNASTPIIGIGNYSNMIGGAYDATPYIYGNVPILFGNNIRVPHIIGSTATPTIAAGTGAGTSPTISISGTDVAGVVNVTTGTSPAASAGVVTITFNTAYGSAPKGVVLTPANANAALLSGPSQVFVPANGQTNGVTTTTFVIQSNAAISASTGYIWTYHVIQ